jgi:2-polyprenyl-3-methyl-5-hydroxy-6-metoxy-1,4-benzoquinol methylase
MVRTLEESVIWHDVECGAYDADLPLWSKLADDFEGPLLELGCGAGRVALHLARHGHAVTGIDSDTDLIAELTARADDEGLTLRAETADATSFELEDHFGLILAPMQLIQLLPGAAARGQSLERIAEHLRPGGMVALAIVEGTVAAVPASPLLPDVRERDGWVYSSLPLGAHEADGSLVIERLRQAVDTEGHLRESRSEVRLQALSAPTLEQEGGRSGLRPAGRRRVAATEEHVGSTVVLLEGS